MWIWHTSGSFNKFTTVPARSARPTARAGASPAPTLDGLSRPLRVG
jgi:hypothetical protein